MTDIEKLIGKIISQSVGNRELDVQIARHTGHDFKDIYRRSFVDVYDACGWVKMSECADSWRVPKYTTSVDAASELKPDGYAQKIKIYSNGCCLVQMRRGEWQSAYDPRSSVTLWAKTEPLARVIAYLRARELENTQ